MALISLLAAPTRQYTRSNTHSATHKAILRSTLIIQCVHTGKWKIKELFRRYSARRVKKKLELFMGDENGITAEGVLFP